MQLFSACPWIDIEETTATNDLVTVNQDHDLEIRVLVYAAIK
ncbi:hypothetical protein V6Z12_D11G390900 [Gossypium hirsutum]